MSTTFGSTAPAGEGRALALVADPLPWYATTPAPAPDRRALEDEHTRILT